ncbi:hypothetical protein LAZ67_13001235 [Cordylochernes scorpioides]|uniref:Uncharacterized protein n=1 Tax=Cordylochernes scorpioides TaxID=51811 RepID=A0ABY6L5K2_9ARAC|nr:hypothetical protein LAZ67_13001235 [Cordylochernes scorpioides]
MPIVRKEEKIRDIPFKIKSYIDSRVSFLLNIIQVFWKFLHTVDDPSCFFLYLLLPTSKLRKVASPKTIPVAIPPFQSFSQALEWKNLSGAASNRGEVAIEENPPGYIAAKLKENFVMVEIFGRKIKALEDSVADFSVISDKFRRELKTPLFKELGLILKAANKNLIETLGKCVLNIEFNGLKNPNGSKNLCMQDITVLFVKLFGTWNGLVTLHFNMSFMLSHKSPKTETSLSACAKTPVIAHWFNSILASVINCIEISMKSSTSSSFSDVTQLSTHRKQTFAPAALCLRCSNVIRFALLQFLDLCPVISQKTQLSSSPWFKRCAAVGVVLLWISFSGIFSALPNPARTNSRRSAPLISSFMNFKRFPSLWELPGSPALSPDWYPASGLRCHICSTCSGRLDSTIGYRNTAFRSAVTPNDSNDLNDAIRGSYRSANVLL